MTARTGSGEFQGYADVKTMGRFVFVRIASGHEDFKNLREKPDSNRSSISVELGLEMWLKGTMASQNAALSTPAVKRL